jgi:dynamin 1-like protein
VEDGESSDGVQSPNGMPGSHDSRSFSATMHDRPKSTTGATLGRASRQPRTSEPFSAGGTSSRSNRAPSVGPYGSKNHHAGHNSQGGGGDNNSTKETFLNYFFGGNGPGPISAASLERNAFHVTAAGAGVHPPTFGRDVSAPDPNLQAGILASKRDGNQAAFDMKSLGKHIEAVRDPSFLFLLQFHC